MGRNKIALNINTSQGETSSDLISEKYLDNSLAERESSDMSGNSPEVVTEPLLGANYKQHVGLNRGVYWVMVLIGAGQLYPYNTLITATDYFDTVFPGKKVTYYNTTILMYPSTMFSLIFIKYGHKIPFSIRIVMSFIIMGAGLSAIPWLSAASGSSGLLSVLLTVGFIGSLMCMNQGGIYGFAGLLPEIYTQGVMTGQAAAGMTVSFTRILTKYFYPATDQGIKTGGKLFFIVGALWLLMCAIGFWIATRGSFAKHYVNKYKESRQALLDSQNNLSIPPETLRAPIVGNSPASFSFRNYLKSSFHENGHDTMFRKPATPKMWGSLQTPTAINGGASKRTRPRTSYRKINHKIYKLGLAGVMVFLATFLPFPGLVVTLESEYKILGNGWFAIVLITEFTVFDTVGRYIAGYTKLGLTKERLWLPILLRFLLYPIFLLYYMRLYHNEIVIFVANAVLAVSNGFLFTIAMMLAPGELLTHEKEVGGSIMSFYAQLGILCGCASALVVSQLLNSLGY